MFFLAPVLAKVAGVFGIPAWMPLALIVIAPVVAVWFAWSRAWLRSLSVSSEGIEWRTLQGRGRARLPEVVSVTDPSRTHGAPEIWLEGATVLVVPWAAADVARHLAELIGQPWAEVPVDSA